MGAGLSIARTNRSAQPSRREPSTLALADVPKRARRAARIRAYVPAGLAERSFSLDAEAVQAVIDAQDAVREAQQYADTVGVNTIAQQLLRS